MGETRVVEGSQQREWLVSEPAGAGEVAAAVAAEAVVGPVGAVEELRRAVGLEFGSPGTPCQWEESGSRRAVRVGVAAAWER